MRNVHHPPTDAQRHFASMMSDAARGGQKTSQIRVDAEARARAGAQLRGIVQAFGFAGLVAITADYARDKIDQYRVSGAEAHAEGRFTEYENPVVAGMAVVAERQERLESERSAAEREEPKQGQGLRRSN